MSAIALLLRRDFALLWWSGLISITGTWMLGVALPIHVYQLTGSAIATSATLIAATVPRILLGSVAGTFVDRWDRRRTMVLGNLLMAAALLPLWLVTTADLVWIVYAVALFQSVVSLFVGPAEHALLPTLVGPEDLLGANFLNSLNNNLARLVGPVLGGLVATFNGLGVVAAVDMATFVVAAALVGLIRAGRRDAPTDGRVPDEVWRGLWREWLLGLAFVRERAVLRLLFVVIALMSLGEGVMGALFVVFVSDVLLGNATHLGTLVSAQAVGSLFGLAVLIPWTRKLRPDRLLGLALVCFGAIDLAIFNAPAVTPRFEVEVALFILVGIPIVVISPALMTLFQTAVPDLYRGRVLGSLGTTEGLFRVTGLALGGLLAAPFGVVAVLNAQGVAQMIAGAVVLRWLAGAGRPGIARTEAAATLSA